MIVWGLSLLRTIFLARPVNDDAVDVVLHVGTYCSVDTNILK